MPAEAAKRRNWLRSLMPTFGPNLIQKTATTSITPHKSQRIFPACPACGCKTRRANRTSCRFTISRWKTYASATPVSRPQDTFYWKCCTTITTNLNRPLGVLQPDKFMARAVLVTLPSDSDWLTAYTPYMKAQLGADFGYTP